MGRMGKGHRLRAQRRLEMTNYANIEDRVLEHCGVPMILHHGMIVCDVCDDVLEDIVMLELKEDAELNRDKPPQEPLPSSAELQLGAEVDIYFVGADGVHRGYSTKDVVVKDFGKSINYHLTEQQKK